MGAVSSFSSRATGCKQVTLFAMSRQNRVSPDGRILALQSRGRAMGNRGPLQDDAGRLVRQWKYKRWICCTLREVNDRKVRLDDPEGYTPLFFTDEAVALAAGHRPCGACRPDAYFQWLAIWKAINGVSKFERVRASAMDQELHERRGLRRNQSACKLQLEEAPNGAFVSAPLISPQPLLVYDGYLWPWREGRYDEPLALNRSITGIDVTGFHFVEFLAAGFRFDLELAPRPQQDMTGGKDD